MIESYVRMIHVLEYIMIMEYVEFVVEHLIR